MTPSMCFVIFAVLHVPRAAADTGNRAELAGTFVALAPCGAAPVFAERLLRRDE